MPRYLGCALTHVVFGVLLFVVGIIDLRVNNRDLRDIGGWLGILTYFVVCCGVWVRIVISFSAVSESKIRLHISVPIKSRKVLKPKITAARVVSVPFRGLIKIYDNTCKKSLRTKQCAKKVNSTQLRMEIFFTHSEAT